MIKLQHWWFHFIHKIWTCTTISFKKKYFRFYKFIENNKLKLNFFQASESFFFHWIIKESKMQEEGKKNSRWRIKKNVSYLIVLSPEGMWKGKKLFFYFQGMKIQKFHRDFSLKQLFYYPPLASSALEISFIKDGCRFRGESFIWCWITTIEALI